jgi:hypothetical protein
MIVMAADIGMAGPVLASTPDRTGTKKDVDARDKRGHDVERFWRCD